MTRFSSGAQPSCTVSPLHAERVRCENAVRISRQPCLPQPVVLGLVFVVAQPNRIQVVLALRALQHAALLRAEQAIRTDLVLVSLLVPGYGFALDTHRLRVVEAVKG